MVHLIDKDTLVAEIEKLEELYCYGESNCMLIAKSVFDSIKNIINTLEVKEVDLEKEIKNEIDEYWYDNDYGAIQRHGGTITMEVSDVKDIAKHFFELGLKAQKGE